MGRHFISDRRTGYPPPTPPQGRGTDTHPQPLPKGGGLTPTPFISDRRTKGQDTPSLREGRGGLLHHPQPLPKGGECRRLGEIRPALELARFQNKVEKERPKQVSPRQRLGNSPQPTFAQNGQKNYYFTHSLCHSAVVGCYSFAPFGGVSMLHPLPPGVARGWHINAPSGRN